MPAMVNTDKDLRLWRAEHKLQVQEAAALLGVSRETVHRWEAGRYPRDLLERMAKGEAARLAQDGHALPDSKGNKRAAAKWRGAVISDYTRASDVRNPSRTKETPAEHKERRFLEGMAKFGLNIWDL